MMSLDWEGLGETMATNTTGSLALMSASLLVLASIFVWYLTTRPRLPNYPVIKLGNASTLRANLMEAALKDPNTPHILPVDEGIVILPTSMMNEIQDLPEHQVSLKKEVQRQFHYKYTGVGEFGPEFIQTIRIDLTRHIAGTLDALQDEVRYAFNKELGPCEEWTAVPLYSKLVRIVALLGGRVFVGRPLSRDEEWIDSSIKYTMDCERSRVAVQRYPLFLRMFIVPFLPEIRRLRYLKKRWAKLLEPTLQECLEKHGKEKVISEESRDEKGVFLSWLLNNENDITPAQMAKHQMMLSFAALHTTTTTTAHAIFDLISRPEYIQPLRDEIEQVIQEDGHDTDGDGFLRLKKQSFNKFRKLDSFLKESQRFNPMGIINMIRLCTSPLTLSNGQTLPKGTRFAFNAHAINFSPETTTYSPEYNPVSNKPPSEFDGFRFANLRLQPGKENKHQFVTTSPESIAFGHGSHACPGRFFASNEIKVILIEMLRSWDLRLKGDVEGIGGEDKRPRNYESKIGISPNMAALVEFRRRKV